MGECSGIVQVLDCRCIPFVIISVVVLCSLFAFRMSPIIKGQRDVADVTLFVLTKRHRTPSEVVAPRSISYYAECSAMRSTRHYPSSPLLF